MARTRRSSPVLDAARQRLSGVKSITPTPDFGTGLTVAGYETAVTTFSTKLDSYNQKLAELDELQNALDADEKDLREQNRRILAAVEAIYGPDSSQFEQAGGKRQSEHKKPTRKGPTSSGGPTPVPHT
jgi:hypothetical protein